jgi:uncharacterized protein YigE (DUF2233 family)
VATRHAQTQTGVGLHKGGHMRFIIGAAVIFIFFGVVAYLADRDVR